MKFSDRTPKEKSLFLLQQGIYIVVIVFSFFLMFLGIIRIYEVNEYFGDEKYQLILTYCEPKGFFGWGYDCDIIQWNKDEGNIPNNYSDIPFIPFIPFVPSLVPSLVPFLVPFNGSVEIS